MQVGNILLNKKIKLYDISKPPYFKAHASIRVKLFSLVWKGVLQAIFDFEEKIHPFKDFGG
jgi:hypothetical protein